MEEGRMLRRRTRRVARRIVAACAVLAGAAGGAVLLSGSDQPVTAHPYPHWQSLPPPPLSPRTGALGLRVGHRVLLLGGVRRDGAPARDGASYDLRTGVWHRARLPVPLTSRDRAVAAGGVAVVRHVVRRGRLHGPASWWTFDPGAGVWARLRHPAGHLSAPSAFGSEVYALSGPRVVVHSVSLGRWTRLPADTLRPAMRGRRVAASRSGTVVTGRAGRSHSLVADRWDGVAWHRSRALPRDLPAGPPHLRPTAASWRGSTALGVGSRVVVVGGGQAWIFTP
jgi:hypothetical protein